ncbi:hypothetical protein LXA47_23955 [Massilia sp. P8910]|uniref:hypothetical protein n=1 Tax=Massilia antarctica TaxID=2765360 RepID=UPI001E4B5F2F|nr:hypothetical protein [Massilia antarctica]MCE3606630.1 hypothetical protein [Massilia antarctica]
MTWSTAKGFWAIGQRLGGQRSIAIALTRVHAVPDPESASLWGEHALCRSVPFHRPRADAEQVVNGKTQSIQNRRFRDYSARRGFSKERFIAGQGQLNSAVELLEPGPEVTALNKFFRERWRDRLARGYVNEQGGLAEFFESVEFYSERWLTLDEMELPAGYAWSSARRWRETWNLQTGKQIDLWTWFNRKGGNWEPSSSEPGKLEFHSSKALQRLALRLIHMDPDCTEQEVSIDDPRLAQNGIAFSSGFGPCLQVAVLPFKAPRYTQILRAAPTVLKICLHSMA